MANILYGVNGEGAGHSTRAREVISHLQEKGHRLHVVSFDRGLQNLQRDFEVTEIYGFRFAYVNNRVRYHRTVAKNLLTAPQARRSLSRLLALVTNGARSWWSPTSSRSPATSVTAAICRLFRSITSTR